MYYFTAGETEVRCWTFLKGTLAPQVKGEDEAVPMFVSFINSVGLTILSPFLLGCGDHSQ